MALGCISTLILIGLAVASGLNYMSFWWSLVPAFFAGSFALSNGHHYSAIVEANRRGQLWVFPLMLALSVGVHLGIAAIIFWTTQSFS